MTKEELKALGLTDEVIAKITEDYGKNYVAKSQFNQKLEELKQAKTERETVNKELEELRKTNEGNKDLQAQIEAMKKAAADRDKDYKAQLLALKTDAAIDTALVTAKAKNAKAVKALLQMEKIKLGDDGKLIGLDEQLKSLQTSDAYLFGDSQASGVVPGSIGSNGDPNNGNPGGAADIQKQFESAIGIGI